MANITRHLDVPIFPLYGTTLFPGQTLTLRLSDSVQQKAATNCVNVDRRAAVAMRMRRDGKKFYRAMCVGRITALRLMNNKEVQIDIVGECRAWLLHTHDISPWLVGKVKVQKPPTRAQRQKAVRLKREFVGLMDALSKAHPKYKEQLKEVRSNENFLDMIDLIAASFVPDYARQSILGQTDPVTRVRLVMVQLRKLLSPPADETGEHFDPDS